ncbi:MAG: sigma-70 family RNA polymerase sigma factor [Notoacmeibacter sp.]|nr:sigma-70 family RNA polymerase sigma factor [Notoacmeibacter sp.]
MSKSTQTPDTEDHTARLVAVGRNADLEAFEGLFRHFGPKIRAYMMKRSADRHLAEELMQETMMTVWNKADQFDPARGAASSWIFTIARNARVDAYRKSGRPAFDPSDPAFVPDGIMAADTMMEMDQEAGRLREAMGSLPPEQVELLKLSFYEEASHSMIAERLNLPIGTVKSRIRLAFSKLRDALGERS